MSTMSYNENVIPLQKISIEQRTQIFIKDKEIHKLNDIINDFNEVMEHIYNNIRSGDESDDFMLVFNKWQDLVKSDWKNYKKEVIKK